MKDNEGKITTQAETAIKRLEKQLEDMGERVERLEMDVRDVVKTLNDLGKLLTR